MLKQKRLQGRDLARRNSNVFSLFDQKQISELKEAFSFIDQNGDGVVDRDDLQEVFQSLAYGVGKDDLDVMLKDCPGSLNFTMFLAMLGEMLQVYTASCQASPAELTKAFDCLAIGGQNGKIHRDGLREALARGPERLSEEEIEMVLQEAAGEEELIDYNEFVKQLKRPF